MIVVIVSEVANPGKQADRSIQNGAILFLVLLLSLPVGTIGTFRTFGTISAARAAEPAEQNLASAPITQSTLGDCNWTVTYRGRTYDLGPLTREALSRPIENDIRFALQRVPESNAHLEVMTKKLREARGFTILASVFVSGFLVTRLLQSGVKNQDVRREYDMASAATGLFFLTSTYSSWRRTSEAKEELVRAVEEFNARSPHKIEPAGPGDLPPES